MLRELSGVSLWAVLVGAVSLSSCDDTPTSNVDEDRLPRDAGGADAKGAAAATPPVEEESDEAPRTGALSGQPAPRMSLVSLDDGSPFDLGASLDPTGASCPDGYLFAFMASWCGYCTQSLPTLVELQDEFPTLGVVVVVTDDKPEGQRAELKKIRDAGLTGTVLLADGPTRDAWLGPGGTVPRYVFVDHDGEVAAQDRGFGENVKARMPAQARRALSSAR